MSSSESTKPLTFGLERKFFCEEGLFQTETDQIFSRHWICVGRIEDFSDIALSNESFFTVSVGTDELIVVRDEHGEVKAFHNICRHRGTRLIDQPTGKLKNACITCPYHAWTYNLEGHLIGAPNMQDSQDFKKADFSLRRVGCVNWCGFILIHLTQPNENFDEAFAPILHRFQPWNLQDLRLGYAMEYDVTANWKLLFQNYNECYHCPTVHPALNRLTPYKSATNDLTEGAILGGPMQLADGFDTVSADGKKIANPFPGLSKSQRRCVYYYTVFPTMFISAHPDYVMVHQIDRITARQSRIRCYFLVDQGTKNEDLARAVNLWDEVNRQDWQVCELTQKGVESSAYIPGPYSNLESVLIAFDRHYRQTIT